MANKVKVVIYVAGGVVQDVIADTDGVEMMLVNYDDEKCGQSSRSFSPITVDSDYVALTASGSE